MNRQLRGRLRATRAGSLPLSNFSQKRRWPHSKEVSICTATANAAGRFGAKDAEIYLGSPATVAASAVAGRITDPREFLG